MVKILFDTFRPLDKGLTIDKIKEIRAKLISNRRTRIKPEDEDAGGKGENLAPAFGELEVRKYNIPRFLDFPSVIFLSSNLYVY